MYTCTHVDTSIHVDTHTVYIHAHAYTYTCTYIHMYIMLSTGNNTCFYGKCYYCRREEAACADGVVMEGAVTLWLPDWYKMKTWRHPYQRTYREGVKARYALLCIASMCRVKILL